MKQEIYYLDTNVLVQLVIPDYDNRGIFASSECVKGFIALIQFNNLKLRKDVKLTSLDIVDFIENQLGYTIRYVNKGHLQQLARLVTIDKHTDPSDASVCALPAFLVERTFEA